MKQKDLLEKGDLIGRAGMTGVSTGPHLHWSIFINGVAVDPEDWMDGSIEKFIFGKEIQGEKPQTENQRTGGS